MSAVDQTLNARPLTLDSSDFKYLTALTAEQFLIFNENVCLLYLPCADELVNDRKLFQQTKAYSNVTLDRISKEYLPTSNNWQKWRSAAYKNPIEGDLVWLIKDSNKREFHNYEAKHRTRIGVHKRTVLKLALVIPNREDGFAMQN